jgi:hypothetical protein
LNEFDLYIGRLSTIETQVEDEYEQTMTHSLMIAHQCTVETLERLENEDNLPSSLDSGGLCPRSFDNQKSQPPLCSQDVGRKRASVWINDLIFENASLPPGFRRHTWVDTECLEFLNQQPHYFLRKWTDQKVNMDKVDNWKLKPPSYLQVGGGHVYNRDDQSSDPTPPLSSEERNPDFSSTFQNGMADSGESNVDKIDSFETLSQTESYRTFFTASDRILLTQ